MNYLSVMALLLCLAFFAWMLKEEGIPTVKRSVSYLIGSFVCVVVAVIASLLSPYTIEQTMRFEKSAIATHLLLILAAVLLGLGLLGLLAGGYKKVFHER